MRTQMQALVLGLIGGLLASPIVVHVVMALSPARVSDAHDIYATATESTWSKVVEVAGPLLQIVGIVLAAVAVVVLLAKGSNPAFRRPIAPAILNFGLAVALAVLTVTMTYMHPPHIDPDMLRFTHTARHVQAGITGSTSWSAAPAPAPTPAR